MSLVKPGKNEVIIVKRVNESLEDLHRAYCSLGDSAAENIKKMLLEIMSENDGVSDSPEELYKLLFIEKYRVRATEAANAITKADYLKAKFWHELRQAYDCGPHLQIGVRKGEFGGMCVVGMLEDVIEVSSEDGIRKSMSILASDMLKDGEAIDKFIEMLKILRRKSKE